MELGGLSVHRVRVQCATNRVDADCLLMLIALTRICHLDAQYLWDAADVGDERAEEEDCDAGAEERTAVTEAAPATEETDFSKRMAMLAQAFS